MPKTKCIICLACNTEKEMSKHFNTVTVLNHKRFLDKIKNKEDINTICEEHRNPLVFNTVVINLFDAWNKFHALAEHVL